LPAGIGAKFGAPQRPGLVLVGDGGFLYTAQELATAVEELDSPLVVLLWNNDALGQIRDDMLGLDIEPIGVLPRNPDFAALARAFGCTVTQPQNLGTANRPAPRLQSQRRHPDRAQACLRSLMFNLYWRE
jgi:5-guanidino-2-oxopentanoate decarboxylase